jgi:two-component system, cell cycle sensor histidine kinase and response regulator CckA
MCADANSLDVLPSLPDAPPAEELARLRMALEQAQRREHELDDTFENGAMPLHWVGPDGTILRANRAELELLGYSRDEYVGHNIAEFHADESVIAELLRRLHADETVRNYAARLRCRDGSIKHVLIDSSVYRAGEEFIHTRCFTRDVTTAVLATEALRYSEERFHLAAEATRDLIWDWDVVGGGVVWAGAVREYLSPLAGEATTSDRLDHRAWAARVHPDDLAQTEAVARTAFESGASSWEHQYQFRRADGTYAYMTEHASIVRDAAGRPIRVVGAMRDDTQRKASEEATLRLAAIVTSATDAIVGKTTRGIVTSWNAAAERMFGYSEREMVGQSIFRLIPQELREEERSLLVRVQRGERVEYSTTERLRKDGSRLSIALSVSPIWDASGRVVGVSSIQRDVTERLRADLELARREERYRALVMATTSVVWTTDPQGQFGDPQPGWEEYTGQPWGEHREWGWLLALHPDDREEFRRAWLGAEERRAFFEAGGRVWHRADHRYRRFIARAAPVLSPDGGIREWIGTLTDVEEQRQAEERLRQADRLESVARLAGGVAHEANNQMTVVLGSAAFLLRRIHDDTAIQDLEQIRDAAQRTAAITQQLLAFSRRQMLQLQLVDLNAVVRKLEPVLQRALGETSRVVVRLAPDLGAVKADPRQLDQVLLNLTFNARDAMQGGGILTIETANVLLEEPSVAGDGLPAMPPGRYARIVVGDTGHGMDRATLGRVFEPFFTTKPVGAGTGLGLSTVYGIVKQSGGFVWVYSEPGQGTTFRIFLPVVAAISSQAPAPAAEPAQGAQEVILIVEDDEAVQGVLARSLREYGYHVIEARDGVEALDVIAKQAEAPRLVVADVVMPRLDGPRLSAELLKRWPDLPVLFISGYTDVDSVSRGLVEQGREFLQKPIEPQTLARKVRAMLEAAGKPAQGSGSE